MDKSVEAAKHEFTTIRTGRASAALLDRVQVSAYGTKMPVNQLATISVPEPRLLTITPFDKSIMKDIERAIQESDLGLTPSNDGQVIRLPIPQLTEERRKELVKQVRHMAEEGRVAARNVRRDARAPPEEARAGRRCRRRRRAPRRGSAPEGHRRARAADRRRAQGQRGRDHGSLIAPVRRAPPGARAPAAGLSRWRARPRRLGPERGDHHGRQRPMGLAVAGFRSWPAIGAGTRALKRTVEAAPDLGCAEPRRLRLLDRELGPAAGTRSTIS